MEIVSKVAMGEKEVQVSSPSYELQLDACSPTHVFRYGSKTGDKTNGVALDRFSDRMGCKIAVLMFCRAFQRARPAASAVPRRPARVNPRPTLRPRSQTSRPPPRNPISIPAISVQTPLLYLPRPHLDRRPQRRPQARQQ
jgi:hypothetical protein